MEQISTHPTKKRSMQQVSHYHPEGRTDYTSKYPPPLLPVSNYTILFMQNALHISGCHSKNSKWMHSLLKCVLGRIRYRYQTYCTVYKTHTMATHNRGAGCPINRDFNLHVEDAKATMTMWVSVTQALLLPWADWRQKVTPINSYPATRPSNSTHKGNKWAMPMSRGQRRTTSRKLGLQRMGATKSLSSTSTTTSPNANTYWALWRSNMSVH